MKKTTNVNIGGYAFVIEEDAYVCLGEYLDQIAENYAADADKDEIIADIEARIGEILSEAKGDGEIITATMVEMVKARVGRPQDLREEDSAVNHKQIGRNPIKRQLFRDPDNRNIGGVCGGLAAYFNVPALGLRLVALSLFIGGLFVFDAYISLAVFLIYSILWICIPLACSVEQRCALHGEPVKLEQFRAYVPARRKSGPRAISAFGRILVAAFSILMIIVGGSMATAGALVPAVNHLWDNILTGSIPLDFPGGPECYTFLMLSPTLWWLVALFVFAPGFGLCYEGLKILIGFKEPRWRPGLVALLLWVASLIGLIVFCILKINSFTQIV